MGTRNLTCVFHDGTYKIAKYGQWDGYPIDLGQEILKFLRTKFEKNSFIENLNKIRFIDENELNNLWKEVGADDSGWATLEVSDRFNKIHYTISRDCKGSELLLAIQNGIVDKQYNDIDFAGSGLFCEWCYVIDLDKNTFEVYKGFNKTELDPNERFASIKRQEEEYSPVKHFKTYSLNKLPTAKKFLKDVVPPDPDDEEEEE
jgi:hypothetical protein